MQTVNYFLQLLFFDSSPAYLSDLVDSSPAYLSDLVDSSPAYLSDLVDSSPAYLSDLVDSSPAYLSDLVDSSPAYLSDHVNTPLPGRFVLLQTHRHSTSCMLKLKHLASALFLIVLQSSGILSLLTSVMFSPPVPSENAIKTHCYKRYRNN